MDTILGTFMPKIKKSTFLKNYTRAKSFLSANQIREIENEQDWISANMQQVLNHKLFFYMEKTEVFLLFIYNLPFHIVVPAPSHDCR